MPFFLLITPPPPPTAHWGTQYSLRTGYGHTSGWQSWSPNHQRLLPKQPSLLKRVVSALAFIATLSFHLLSLETLKSFLTPLSLSPHIQSHSKPCQFCLQPMNKMSCIPIKLLFIKWHHQPLKNPGTKTWSPFPLFLYLFLPFCYLRNVTSWPLPAVLYCRLLLGADASSPRLPVLMASQSTIFTTWTWSKFLKPAMTSHCLQKEIQRLSPAGVNIRCCEHQFI